MGLNTISLTSGYTTVYAIDPPPNFQGLINYIDMFSGAARYGIGEFCLVRSDYDALVTASNSSNGQITLTMGSPNQGSAIVSGQYTNPSQGTTVSIPVILAGNQTLSGNVGGYTFTSLSPTAPNYIIGSPNDIVKVVVKDFRYTQNQTVTAAFNVQEDGFPYSGSTPLFYTETYKTGTTPYAWTDVASSISSLSSLTSGSNALAIPTSASLPAPTWNPRNLIFDSIPWNKVVDSIAARLYLVTGWDIINKIYSWNLPGTLNSNNLVLLNAALGISGTASYLNSGNVGERNLASLPGKYDIIFKTIGPDDPYTTRIYKKSVSTGFPNSNSGIVQPIQYGDYIAVVPMAGGSGGTLPNNQTELDIVATDIAARAAIFQSQPIYQLEFVGLWNFILDGAIRGIRWISNQDGARTILRFNNEKEFSASDEIVRTSENLSNQLIVGLGDYNVACGPGGTRNIYSNDLWNTDSFLVDVVQTGGSAGSDTAPCSYTYSAYTHGFAGNSSYLLGTVLSPIYPRPTQYGQCIAAEYGLGQYTNGVFGLITVSEVLYVDYCSGSGGSGGSGG